VLQGIRLDESPPVVATPPALQFGIHDSDLRPPERYTELAMEVDDDEPSDQLHAQDNPIIAPDNVERDIDSSLAVEEYPETKAKTAVKR